ncbi:MAG: outer membrane protein [Rhizomicrobium sp.]
MKSRWIVAAACAVLGGTGAAHADIFTTGLYTVINYAAVVPTYKAVSGVSTPSYLDGVEADVGWRFNRYYSVEASYDYSTGNTGSGSATFDQTLQSASLDALGYLPFGLDSAWALYGDVGGAAFFAHAQTPLASGNDESRFGARAGGGLQYQFSDDIGLRIGGRYEWTGLPTLKSAEIFAVGLVWQR